MRELQNLMKRVANSDFRSGVKRDEQDLPVRQKTNTSKGSNFAMKCEKVVSKVVVLKVEARKHRSDSKLNSSEMPADVSHTKGLQAKQWVISCFIVITAIQIV